jgi:hypothetical protein
MGPGSSRGQLHRYGQPPRADLTRAAGKARKWVIRVPATRQARQLSTARNRYAPYEVTIFGAGSAAQPGQETVFGVEVLEAKGAYAHGAVFSGGLVVPVELTAGATGVHPGPGRVPKVMPTLTHPHIPGADRKRDQAADGNRARSRHCCAPPLT